VRPGDGVTAIVGGDVYTIAEGTFRRGTVLVRDGRILKVGVDLEVPEGARVLDASGKRVLPGFVAPRGSGIGLSPGQPQPGSRYRDAVDAFARSNELALAAGVTAFHAQAPARGGVSSDLTAVLKPAAGDRDRMVLREPASLVVAWTNAAAADRVSFEESLRRGRAWMRENEEVQRLAARGVKRDPPRKTVGDEVLAALRRELPVRIAASRAEDIRDALRLAGDHGLRLVIEDATEAWVLPDEIARAGATAIVTPRRKVRPDPRADHPTGGNLEVAGILERAGAKFCILPPGSLGGPGDSVALGGLAGRDLLAYPIEGAFAVRGGASEEAVLRALTLGAAEALGVDDRIGSITPGKDADLILLDGDPFHYRTVVDLAMIEGKVLYERSKSSLFQKLPGR